MISRANINAARIRLAKLDDDSQGAFPKTWLGKARAVGSNATQAMRCGFNLIPGVATYTGILDVADSVVGSHASNWTRFKLFTRGVSAMAADGALLFLTPASLAVRAVNYGVQIGFAAKDTVDALNHALPAPVGADPA